MSDRDVAERICSGMTVSVSVNAGQRGCGSVRGGVGKVDLKIGQNTFEPMLSNFSEQTSERQFNLKNEAETMDADDVDGG